MWRCVANPPTEAVGRAVTSPTPTCNRPCSLKITRTTGAASAAKVQDACDCHVRGHTTQLYACWGSRPWRHTTRRVTLGAAVEAGPATGSSGSDGGSDAQRLQPKPQAKLRRLATPGSDNAPSKPRRWHKVAPSLETSLSRSTAPATASHTQSGAQQPKQSQQGSYGSGGASGSDSQEASLMEPGHGDQQQQQQHPQRQLQKPKPARQLLQQQQRGPGRLGRQSSSAAVARTGSSQRNWRDTPYYQDDTEDEDEKDEDEDEDEDGELLGLSEEELEAMVFASAGANANVGSATGLTSGPEASTSSAAAAAMETSTTAGGSKPRRRQAAAGAAAAAVAPSASDVLAAAGLPGELEPLVQAAIRSGGLSSDSAILTDQLRQLRDAAAAAAMGGPADADVTTAAAAIAPGVTVDVLRASVAAAADLLGCSTEAAAAVLINHPRYVGMLSPGGDALERLRSFAGMLKLDLAQTRDVVRRNPALLLIPYEPLRQKLTALANATGLSMAQATAMVSAYMFPEL